MNNEGWGESYTEQEGRNKLESSGAATRKPLSNRFTLRIGNKLSTITYRRVTLQDNVLYSGEPQRVFIL